MKYLSVCSGIEAATCAWHPLGWEPFAFSEIEKFPSQVLAHHYPTVPNLGDMTKFEEWPDATIDLLVGGTPCQSFSVAGLRKGLADPRGNLMLTYGAIARRYRPKWLVWENVPGVLSSNGGRDFGTFLGMLGQLGYGFAYRILDAQHFGVPQRRRRVFVVGHLGDWRRAAAVLFERHSLHGNPAPSREAWKVAPTIPARSLGGGGLGTDFDCDGGLISSVAGTIGANHGNIKAEHAWTGQLVSQPFAVANTLTQRMHKGMNSDCNEGQTLTVCVTGDVTHTLKAEGFDASEDGTGRGNPIIAFSSKDYGGDAANNICPTLRSLGAYNSNGGGNMAVASSVQVRRLTPRECERLQGFPDDYTLIPWRNKPASECPDGPRYKALGNSMAVPVMAWIGRRISEVETNLPEMAITRRAA